MNLKTEELVDHYTTFLHDGRSVPIGRRVYIQIYSKVEFSFQMHTHDLGSHAEHGSNYGHSTGEEMGVEVKVGKEWW